MDLSQDEREDYERELEDISEKQIMLEIMAELKTIRYYMEQETTEEPRSESEYECHICGATVLEPNRKAHLNKQHDAPGVIDIEHEFTKVS